MAQVQLSCFQQRVFNSLREFVIVLPLVESVVEDMQTARQSGGKHGKAHRATPEHGSSGRKPWHGRARFRRHIHTPSGRSLGDAVQILTPP